MFCFTMPVCPMPTERKKLENDDEFKSMLWSPKTPDEVNVWYQPMNRTLGTFAELFPWLWNLSWLFQNESMSKLDGTLKGYDAFQKSVGDFDPLSLMNKVDVDRTVVEANDDSITEVMPKIIRRNAAEMTPTAFVKWYKGVYKDTLFYKDMGDAFFDRAFKLAPKLEAEMIGLTYDPAVWVQLDEKDVRYDILVAKGVKVPKPKDYDRLTKNRKLIP